jgi:hypothetical protein
MFIEDRVILVADILGEYLADEAAASSEMMEAMRIFDERGIARPAEIVFNTDDPARAWQEKRRLLLRRAFALKRGLSFEEIKDLPFRDLVKLVPPRDR